MNYECISTIEEFGTQLLKTGDLDPLYIALYKANLESNQLKRWLFCYWCCYNAGASSWISEQENFWDAMAIMAANELPTPLGTRWPRGHERRHFRGEKAVEAVKKYSCTAPETLVLSIIMKGPKFCDIRTQVMKLSQFGPWIAFKVGDMLERVLGIPVDFSDSDVFMFEQPYQSALNVAKSKWPQPDSEQRAVRNTIFYLLDYFKNSLAPPRQDRPINIQECETILCKWKSHLSGSYPLLLDTKELREGLIKWAKVSPTAANIFWGAPVVD